MHLFSLIAICFNYLFISVLVDPCDMSSTPNYDDNGFEDDFEDSFEESDNTKN